MKRKILFALSSAILFFLACNDKPDADKMSVVTTIEPVRFIISSILGEKGETASLVLSNQDVHSPDLMPLTMKNITDADFIFFLGSGIEFEDKNAKALIKNARDVSIVFLSENFDSVYDPHIWVSLKNIKIIADAVCGALSAYDRENGAYYKDNFKALSSRAENAESILVERALKLSL